MNKINNGIELRSTSIISFYAFILIFKDNIHYSVFLIILQIIIKSSKKEMENKPLESMTVFNML